MEFDLSVADGNPRLTASDRALFGWVKLDALELEVPVRGEPIAEKATAAEFRTRRTRATRVSLRMEQADLDAFCAARGASLGSHSIDEISLRAMDGFLSLGARVRVRGHVAEMTARLLTTGRQRGVRLLIDEARTYGFLPEPAPLLAHRTVRELLGSETSPWSEALGLAEFGVEPVAALLWNTLPSSGWRLPDTESLVCESIRCRMGELTIVFADKRVVQSGRVGPTNPFSPLSNNLSVFDAADRLLLAGDVSGALRAYRAELSARGPEHAFLIDRVLSVAASQTDYFVDALELARQALGRWPDFAPAHNALASIASAQNDGLEAAHRFQILATSHALVGDHDAAAKAALAGARLLRRLSPAESTALYELVLEHSPFDSETAEALSERYRQENRWDDLLTLIRHRAARATDPAAAARDHLRLAQILAEALGDSRSAREELRIAARLDAESGSAREALARIELDLGDTSAAVRNYDEAAELFMEKADSRNAVRALLAAAELVCRDGDDGAAEKRYRAILTRVPNEPAALRGAAAAAGRGGRWAEAAELWRMLLLSCSDSALAQAECSYELGRALTRDGDTEGARPALERAARSSPPIIAAESHALLAEIFRGEGQLQAAAIELAASITALTSAAGHHTPGHTPPVRLRSRAAELSLERGLLLSEMGQDDGAADEFRRAFEHGEERLAVRREAASALLQLASGDSASEKQWLGALLDSDPEESERQRLLFRRARLRLEIDGDTHGASQDLALGLAVPGSDLSLTREAHELKAQISWQRGDSEMRAEALAAAAEIGSDIDAARASVDAAAAFLETDKPQKASASAKRALGLLEVLEESDAADELSIRAHLAIVDADWRRRDHKDVASSARILLSRADELSGTDRAVTKFRLAVALDRKGDENEAIDRYSDIDSDPAADTELRNEARKHLAQLFERLGRYQEAAERFSALASDPNSPLPKGARADFWYRAAELFRKHQARSADAEACLEETLKLVSDHMPALDALETLKRDSDDYERVAVILGRKIAATSRHPSRQKSLLVRLAALQEEVLGRADVARESYRRALEIDPLFRPALRFAARDALDSGHPKIAVELFGQLTHALPDDIDLSDGPTELRAERAKSALRLAAIAAGADDEAMTAVAREALERTRTDSDDDSALASALEALYRRSRDWRSLAASLGDESRSTLGRELERIELLWRQLGDPAAALVATRRARDRYAEEERLREYEEALEELTAVTDSTANPGFAQEVAEALKAATEARARGEDAVALAHLDGMAGPASPDDLLVLRAALREEAGQWQRTAHDLTMLRRRAASAGDFDREHKLCRKLAVLTAEKLGDGMTALALYERVLELDPDDLAAAEACISLFERRGDRAARATALERVVAIARRTGAGPQTLASALRDLAHFALSEGRPERAQARLEEALEEAPGDEATLRLLASVQADRGDVSAQCETLRILAGALADRAGGTSASAGELYLELADLHYDALSAPSKGREAMMVAARVFGAGSRSRSILRLLANEANGAGDNATVVEALELVPEKELASSDFIMLSKAFQRASRDQEAVSALETARKRGRLDDEGALLLLGLYRQLGRKRELARSLEAGASEAPAVIAATRLQEALNLYRVTLCDEEAAALVEKQLTELAHVHQDGVDPSLSSQPSPDELERAADAAAAGHETAVAANLLAQALSKRANALSEHSLEIDEPTLRTLDSLRSLARRDSHYEALSRGLTAVASIKAASPATSKLLREAAAITRQHLHDTRGGADLLARALALSPADSTLCEELDATLREAGDYSQLVSAYELHLGAVTGRQRAQPLLELARLYRDIWHDAARAKSYLSEVLKVAPELRDELDRELAEVEIASAKGAEKSDGGVIVRPRSGQESDRRRIDKLLERTKELEESGQIDAAIAQAERAASIAGGDPRPLHALERLYESADDWGAVSEVLGRLAAASQDPMAAGEIWFRRANLYRDVLHREPEAYRCLKEAFANDPESGTIANALRSVAMARGEWALAAELLYREIAAASIDLDRGALYLELALIYDEKLLDVDAAMVNYEQALAFDPEIPAAPRPLGRLYELRGRHREASEMFELAAARARSDADRGRLLHHAGQSAEHAELFEEARRLYGLAAVAGSTEDHEKAQVALARLREGEIGNAFDSRIRMLEARLEETQDDATERALRRELLELASSRGDALAEAHHARELLDADRTDVSAYLALKSQATEAGDWQQLASLLSARASVVDDQQECAALYFELGRAYQDDLGDLNAAVGAYQQALASVPEHSGSLEALAEITYRKHDWIRAYPIYKKLVPESCSMPADVIALRRGEIAEALGREHEASDAFAEAVRLFPASRVALTALARCAKRVGDLKRAITATRAILELAPATNVNATTRARGELASLLARTGDITGAIYYYELVVAEEPKANTALGELLALYSEKGDFDGAARCTRSLIALTVDATQRADLLYRLGEIYRERLGDPDLAADAYLKGIDLAPNHPPILRRLLPYYFRIGDAEQIVQVAAELDGTDNLAHADTEDDELGIALVFSADAAHWKLVDAIDEYFGATTSARLVRGLVEITRTERSAWSPAFVSAAGAAVCAHAGIDGKEVFHRVTELAESDDAAAALLSALGG